MKTYNWEGVNPDGYFLDKLEQYHQLYRLSRNCSKYRQQLYQYHEKYQPHQRSEERFSRNAETDLVCRLLLEKKFTSMVRNQVHISLTKIHIPLALHMPNDSSVS